MVSIKTPSLVSAVEGDLIKERKLSAGFKGIVTLSQWMLEIFETWEMRTIEVWKWNCPLLKKLIYLRTNCGRYRLRLALRLVLSLEDCIPSNLPLIFFSRILFQYLFSFSPLSSIIWYLFIDDFPVDNEAIIFHIQKRGKSISFGFLFPSNAHLISPHLSLSFLNDEVSDWCFISWWAIFDTTA